MSDFLYNGIPTSTYNYQTGNYGLQGVTNSYNPNFNNSPDTGSGWWGTYLTSLGDYVKNNPTAPLNAVGSIWNAYTGWKNNRDSLALARDNYNLQKKAWEANEARAQEAFNWQRQNRSTTQL